MKRQKERERILVQGMAFSLIRLPASRGGWVFLGARIAWRSVLTGSFLPFTEVGGF